MEDANETLAAFGRRIGLKDFSLTRAGCAQLRFESGMMLSFEAMQDVLLISTQTQSDDPFSAAEWLLREINLFTHKQAVFVGLGSDDCIILAMRITLSKLTVTSIDSAVTLLLALSRRAIGDRRA